jgi:hypothetical protein
MPIADPLNAVCAPAGIPGRACVASGHDRARLVA